MKIWIVHDGLTGENIQELRKAVAAYPHVLLHFSTMPDKLAAVLDHRDVKRFSSLAYARLLARQPFALSQPNSVSGCGIRSSMRM